MVTYEQEHEEGTRVGTPRSEQEVVDALKKAGAKKAAADLQAILDRDRDFRQGLVKKLRNIRGSKTRH